MLASLGVLPPDSSIISPTETENATDVVVSIDTGQRSKKEQNAETKEEAQQDELPQGDNNENQLEDMKEQQKEGQTSTAAAGRSFPTLYGLWYINARDEDLYVLHEMKRSVLRAKIGSGIPGAMFFVAGMDEWRRADRDDFVALSCMVSGIVSIVATIFISLLLCWYDQAAKEETASDTAESTSHSSKRASQTTKMRIVPSEWIKKNTPRIHEGRSAFLNLWFVILLVLNYRIKQHHCRFEPRYDHSPENHTECPFRLFWPIFFCSVFSIFTGQPRFMFVAATAFITVIIIACTMQFNNTSPFGYSFIYILLIGLQFQATILKWFEERHSRNRFEAQVELRRQHRIIKEQAASLAEFVDSITPTYLKSRLAEGAQSNTLSVDNASQAMCLVLNIRNVVQFMHSMLPRDSASALAILSSQCENRSLAVDVHHIRTVGDTMYFVSNLFRQDAPSAAAAAVNGIRFAEGLWEPCSALDLRCGLSIGPLIGLPLGSTCIRYDVVGTALSEAESLTHRALSQHVAVSAQTAEAMKTLVLINCATDEHPLSSDSEEEVATIYHVKNVGPAVAKVPGSVLPDAVALPSSQTSSSPTTHAVDHIIRTPHQVFPTAADVSQDLNLEAYGLVFTRFADKDVENEAITLLCKEGRVPLKLASWFYALLVVLMVCVVVDEGKLTEEAASSNNHAQVFLTLMVIGFGCFVTTGVSSQVRTDPLKPWQHATFFTGCISVFTAVHFMRPSLISDSTAYLAIFFTSSVLFIGAKAPMTVAFICLIVSLEVVLGLLIHPLATRVFFIFPLCFATLVNTCLVYHQQDRKTLEYNLRTLAAVHEIARQDELKGAVLRSIIPSQLQDRMCRHALHGSNYFRCWSRDDCVVVTFTIPLALPTGPINVADLCDRAAATTGLVERLVGECRYQSLDVVKVFGGTIIVAGPLEGYQNQLQHAISDALQLIESMLVQEEHFLHFTASAVFEQIMNAARFSTYPSFELLGPAVNLSRSLVAAAPAHMVIASERFVDIYQRELPARPAIAVAQLESWRVRGLGLLRVSRITLVSPSLCK